MLNIEVATFYGCSSGAVVALFLAAYHSNRVQSVIVHEAPLHRFGELDELAQMDDENIIIGCRHYFANVFNEDSDAWIGLGPEFHARLDKNFVPWIRGYPGPVADYKLSNEELTRRPVTWTIGALTPAGIFFDSVVTATKAGIEIGFVEFEAFSAA